MSKGKVTVGEEELERWLKLPPLIRAALGAELYETFSRLSAKGANTLHAQQRVGLLRRAKVSHGFLRATDLLENLFVSLTICADEEVARAGFDAMWDIDDPGKSGGDR